MPTARIPCFLSFSPWCARPSAWIGLSKVSSPGRQLEAAYLTGDYAKGRDTGVIDLLLVGEIDRHNLSISCPRPNDTSGERSEPGVVEW